MYYFISVPGDWMEWSLWGICSATCGGGTRIRTRECDMESYGDLTAPCEGEHEQTEGCHPYDCSPYGNS